MRPSAFTTATVNHVLVHRCALVGRHQQHQRLDEAVFQVLGQLHHLGHDLAGETVDLLQRDDADLWMDLGRVGLRGSRLQGGDAFHFHGEIPQTVAASLSMIFCTFSSSVALVKGLMM